MKKDEFLKLSYLDKIRVCKLIAKGIIKFEDMEDKTMLSRETRAKSFKEINIKETQKQVLECLGNKEMTAREVANEMKRRGFSATNERNVAAPRLTELFENRKVVIVAKKFDEVTGKNVVVYKKAGDLNEQ